MVPSSFRELFERSEEEQCRRLETPMISTYNRSKQFVEACELCSDLDCHWVCEFRAQLHRARIILFDQMPERDELCDVVKILFEPESRWILKMEPAM